MLTDGEREELRHLDYLAARIKELLDRGLITSESVRHDRSPKAVCGGMSIERQGRYKAAMRQARGHRQGEAR